MGLCMVKAFDENSEEFAKMKSACIGTEPV
jgi:hypothetical protein